MTTLSDEALLARLQDGDSGALTTLYRRHQGRVYRFALAMSGEAHTAEEVTQEVFLVLLQGGTGYRPESGSFLPYLMGMARNHVLRALRRNLRRLFLQCRVNGHVLTAPFTLTVKP